MEIKHELREIDIKNHMCYYFDDTMRVRDIDFGDILLDEKLYKTYKNILMDDISCKIFMSLKLLFIRFHEIDEFVKIYDGIIYLI